jgi:carboxyl-terminal processing protease
MLKRTKLVILSILAAAILLITCAGCDIFAFTSSTTTKPGSNLVDEAWIVLSKQYVEPDKVDSTKLDRAAVEAMVDALNDPYSTYLDPDEYKLEQTQTSGTFGGIGATVGVRNGKIIIVAPIQGTPAAKAGIKAGDTIVAVNGESIDGLSVQEVVMKIRGEAGTSVKVTIQHDGESNPVEMDLIRANIDVPSVSYELRENMAYIQIYYFSDRTDEELVPFLKQLKNDGAKGIILDLRSNPGGPVETVVNVASDFLDSGMVIYLVDNTGKETSYPVRSSPVRTNLPMVVLTDNYSASGSEVLSGALQDHQRAIVAGKVTYGKGSADRWFELSDGSAIYLTVSRWLTPNRRLIEGKGIQPDYKLDLEGDDLINWAIDYLKNKK